MLYTPAVPLQRLSTSDCGVGGQSSYLGREDRLHVVARVTLPDLPQHHLVLVMHQDEGTPQNALVPRLIEFCSQHTVMSMPYLGSLVYDQAAHKTNAKR